MGAEGGDTGSYHAVITGSATAKEPQSGDWFANYALLAPSTYFLSEKWYGYGRFDSVFKGSQPGDDLEDFTALAVGAGYVPYQWTNRFKVNFELSYLPQAINYTLVEPDGQLGWLPSFEKGQWNFRAQTQIGF